MADYLMIAVKTIVDRYPEIRKSLDMETISMLEDIGTYTPSELYDLVYGVKTQEHYERQLWKIVQDYFQNKIDAYSYIDQITKVISNQLEKAFNEGARAVDVDPSEFTSKDLAELTSIINSEYGYVLELATDIENARANGMTIQEFRQAFRNRISLWANRYKDTVNRAKVYFGKKVKLMWKLGRTKEHCSTCSKLNGMVAWGEEWEESGIHPQEPPNGHLECGGWKCECDLIVTKKRRSPHALTRLQNIAEGL